MKDDRTARRACAARARRAATRPERPSGGPRDEPLEVSIAHDDTAMRSSESWRDATTRGFVALRLRMKTPEGKASRACDERNRSLLATLERGVARATQPSGVFIRSPRRGACALTRRAHPFRATAFAGENGRGTRAAAFRGENFSLEVATRRSGIKHGTARGELTPRVRAGRTFPTPTTRNRAESPHHANPSRLDRLCHRGPARLGRLLEGCNLLREDQGGPP